MDSGITGEELEEMKRRARRIFLIEDDTFVTTGNSPDPVQAETEEPEIEYRHTLRGFLERKHRR